MVPSEARTRYLLNSSQAFYRCKTAFHKRLDVCNHSNRNIKANGNLVDILPLLASKHILISCLLSCTPGLKRGIL